MRTNKKVMLVTDKGKVVERFKLTATAYSQKHFYEKRYGQKLKVVKESDDKDLNSSIPTHIIR